MNAQAAEEIKSEILRWLEGTRFASASLEPLSGSTANFIYRAHLVEPLDDAASTTDVLVKHGEGYVANHPDFKLTTFRCLIEEECLKALASFRITAKPDPISPYNYVVRTPKCFLFDEKSNTQVQEYLPNGVDLKTYALKNFPSPTPESQRPQCLQLGKSLGKWLRAFHDWTAEHPKLGAELAKNQEMQAMKHMINYQWLIRRIEQFPDILGEAKEVFEEVEMMAAEELKGDIQPIHGDFWSGNVLLPDAPIQGGDEVPMFVIDWELAQLGVRNLDLGQMIAELYELWLYKKIEAGRWMVEGFVEGYGVVTRGFAFRTVIQVGCHLVCFGTSVPGWGTPEQVKDVARLGRDLIINGWQEDTEWLQRSDLGCLLDQSVGE
ncbi:kinase-like domain-containing protein [Xylariales sp. AK1849]|nr:kinase-like domain-containing protein [Xylariales sp. AK1849]